MAQIVFKLQIFFSFICLAWSQSHADRARLYRDLFHGYHPLFIPVTNTSVVQRVIMEANLHKIIDVNTEAGELKTLIWLDMTWDDDFLKWVKTGLIE